ncbi:SIS domain-containing protein [Planctomycetales bacterium ZRK34]|nr:SIS domain-containing protein [Planctomycetales bacterium ZRK34]
MPAFTTCSTATEYFDRMREVFDRVDAAAIDAYADCIFDTWRNRRRVFLCGNGGSAYTASHHVADYVKTASVEGQPRLHAISLNDNLGLLTALGNDVSYDDIFVWPLDAYEAKAGDVLVAISCSGNSPNVVKAVQWAKDHGVTTVCLTGFSGGKIGDLADIHIHFPSDNYGVIEDCQMSVGHIVAQALQQRIANTSQ